MKNRVLVFCGGYILGGAETVTLAYLTELIKQNVEVYCITNEWSNKEFDSKLKELNIPFTSVKLGFIYPKNLSWTFDTLVNLPSALKKIKQLMITFQPSVCYHTSPRTIFMLQHFLRATHFCHIHENIPNSSFNRFIFRSISKRTQKFIGVSNSTIFDLVDIGINKSKVILLYNGTVIQPERTIQKSFENLEIGIVGQVTKSKGHELLLETLAKLKLQGYQRFELKIFGDGQTDYVMHLKKKIIDLKLERHVKWMGFVHNLDDIYNDINILVMPTLSNEAFGMVLIEAGTRNTLVLASDLGGPKEIIMNDFNGLLFEPRNSENLCMKFSEIINNGSKNNALIKNNYHKIKIDFNIELQAQRLFNILFS